MQESELGTAGDHDQAVVSQASGSEPIEITEFHGVQVDRELDLRGKVCPYTFVESMLALEDMEMGQVLRVIVDYGPSACDVPKSLASEGYDVLDVSKINETDWAIFVKNKPFEG